MLNLLITRNVTRCALLAAVRVCQHAAFAQTDAVKTAPKRATAATLQANHAVAKSMAFNDAQDFADAARGLVATLPDPQVKTADGQVVWGTNRVDFIKGDAPAAVNPSLWRQEKFNNAHGLFKVTEGIYQVRGDDIANMTLVERKTGWIVINPVLTSEIAGATFAVALKALAAVFANVQMFDPFFKFRDALTQVGSDRLVCSEGSYKIVYIFTT
jgi:alkyl sulfatase BDS1-like metallo-beta-lactamase superfamily hydrolase